MKNTKKSDDVTYEMVFATQKCLPKDKITNFACLLFHHLSIPLKQ